MKNIANHSERRFRLPMNLQLFAEGDQPDTTTTVDADDPNATNEQKLSADQEPFLKVTYNKEEINLDRDKAVEYTQKGMNYDKAIERAKEESRQEARDALIAENGFSWNGKPITTEADYKQALQEQELIKAYKEKEVPDELIPELVEDKINSDQYKKQQQSIQDKNKLEKEFGDFIAVYSDVTPNDIPKSVWEEVEKGSRLVDAYARHENQSLKQRLASMTENKSIEERNAENASSSTGSVTGKGANAPAFFTREQVQKMTDAEVDKNWAVVMESQKKW